MDAPVGIGWLEVRHQFDYILWKGIRAVEITAKGARGGGVRSRRATERKIVHTYLSERADVETHSEGDEPDRRLVISPAPAFREP